MTTALVYRVAPHPELDVVVQVIREMDPAGVIVVDPAANDDDTVTARLRAAIRNPRADHEDVPC